MIDSCVLFKTHESSLKLSFNAHSSKLEKQCDTEAAGRYEALRTKKKVCLACLRRETPAVAAAAAVVSRKVWRNFRPCGFLGVSERSF